MCRDVLLNFLQVYRSGLCKGFLLGAAAVLDTRNDSDFRCVRQLKMIFEVVKVKVSAGERMEAVRNENPICDFPRIVPAACDAVLSNQTDFIVISLDDGDRQF